MHQPLIRHVLPLLAGIALAGAVPARAGETRSFYIPQRDGYGIGECLSHTGECGRVVADSWCEAHGMSKAASYGLASDVTAAIPRPAAQKEAPGVPTDPDSYVINCEQ